MFVIFIGMTNRLNVSFLPVLYVLFIGVLVRIFQPIEDPKSVYVDKVENKVVIGSFKKTDEVSQPNDPINKLYIINGKEYFSRVDIELINEQIKLFYSAFDEVSIEYDDKTFSITEYVPLGLNDKTSYYPLEKQTLTFFDNGYYKIENEFLFDPPQYNRKMMFHIYNSNLALLQKLQKGTALSENEKRDLLNLPSTLMICFLNGFEEAKQKLIDAKTLLKSVENQMVYINFKETLRILRKVKYDKNND